MKRVDSLIHVVQSNTILKNTFKLHCKSKAMFGGVSNMTYIE